MSRLTSSSSSPACHFPSLCIPRVFANITEERIRSIFEKLDIAELSRIDIVKTADEKFNRVYVHLSRWKSNDDGNQVRKCVMDGKEFKVVYDDPWFWKISAYRNNNNNNTQEKEKEKEKEPRIVFDDDKKKKRKHETKKSDDDKTKKSSKKSVATTTAATKPVKVEKVEVLTEAQPLLKQDEEIKCKQCSKVFLFLVKDQEFYQSKGFYNKPLRCKDCAKANSASRTAAAAIIVTPKFIEPIPPPPKIRTEEEEEEESGKLEKKKKKKKTTLLLGLVFIEEEEEE